MTSDSASYIMSVLFDPCFKKLYFDAKSAAFCSPVIIVKFINVVKTLVLGKSHNPISDKYLKLSQQSNNYDMLIIMFALSSPNSSTSNEINKYLGLVCVDPLAILLDNWQLHQKIYPHLSLIAKDVFSITESADAVISVFNSRWDSLKLKHHSLKAEIKGFLLFVCAALIKS